MRPRRIALNTAALAVLAVMIFPVYWMVVTSFKSATDIQSETPTLWPAHPTIEHFATAVAPTGSGRSGATA